MNNIEQQICEAVDIIVQRAVSQAEFDRTIQGTVLSCVDATIGKYKIKYQDSSFYAYASNAEVTYNNGSSVYILVPGNDLSRDKTILGTTKRLGLNYISTITEQDAYNIVGNNTIINNNSEFSLVSYDSKDDSKNTIVLYDKNKTDNLLQLDIVGLKDYLSQSTHLICGSTFRTQLPIEQQAYGDYGIIFTLNFKDHSTEESVSKHYVINTDKMSGNPYKLLNDTEQIGYFEIDGKSFIEVESIILFEKNFPKERENEKEYISDIFIKNLKLFGATHLSAEELDSYSLSLMTPQGTYFDETTIADKTIQAQVKIKGRTVDKNSQQIAFYWFSEKADVLTNSPEYSSYGGQGWKCLNTEKILVEAEYNEDGSLKSPKIVEWVPAGDTIILRKSDINVKEKKYKCVVVYDKNVFSKEIIIKNYDAEYELEITSDLGTTFYLDAGNPILTCHIKKQGQDLEDLNNFNFAWFSIDNTGYFQAEKIFEKPYQIQPAINLITNFKIFKCNVSTKDGDFLGVASISLTNILDAKEDLYTLMIENGTRVFKYDENGISPVNESQENPMTLSELTFYIYDNTQGTIIKGDTLPNAVATWSVPSEDTMLKGLGDGKEDFINKVIKFSGASLSYTILDRYQINSQRNDIELRVEYNGVQLLAKTNFLFVKEGEVGTNGTSFVCRIVPNVKSNEIMPKPMLLNGVLNYTPKEIDKWFRVQLWQDGEQIFDDYKSGQTLNTNEDVKVFGWSIYQNKYGPYNASDASVKYVTEYSNIKINDEFNLEEGSLYEASFEYQKIPDIKNLFYLTGDNIAISNIIKVGVKYNNKDFYCSQSIPTIDYESGCRVDIKGGFNYVIYDSDGTNPKYDKNEPFTISVFQEDGTDISKELEYNWHLESFIYEKQEDNLWQAVSVDNLKEDTYKDDVVSEYAPKNSFYVKPINQIDGSCLANNVCCEIYQATGKWVASVRIPIHLYLNRFGLASLNGWDGNSVSINEEGGFILAPQIGAGTKNSNNQFTGIVMGEVKEANAASADVGLVGYSEGQRSIFLNAKDGSATFGVAGKGQIIMDPKEGAVLRSGNYSETEGMEISLSDPHINFGSGKFKVNSEGVLSCSGAKVDGEIRATVGENKINFSEGYSYIHFEKKSLDEAYTFQCELSPTDFYIQNLDSLTKEVISGIRFYNKELEIIGTIKATSGTIGGWRIEKDKIRAIDGSLVLYADGHILGTKNNTGKSGVLASEYDYEMTEVTGGSIYMYRRNSLDEDWNTEGVKKRQGRIYTNDKFGGGLTLSSDGDRPLCFAVGGKIVMKLKHDGVKNGSPQNARLCFVTAKDGKEEEYTSLYRKKISSQDFEIQPTSTYKLQETSLKSLLNSHCVVPDKVSFDKDTNIITETWAVEREEIQQTEVTNPETGQVEIKEELVKKIHNFSRQFSLTVKDEGTEQEEVTALNVLNEKGEIVHTIEFEGF